MNVYCMCAFKAGNLPFVFNSFIYIFRLILKKIQLLNNITKKSVNYLCKLSWHLKTAIFGNYWTVEWKKYRYYFLISISIEFWGFSKRVTCGSMMLKKKKNDEIFLIIKLDEVCKSENKLNVTLNYVYSPLKKVDKRILTWTWRPHFPGVEGRISPSDSDTLLIN